MQAALKPPVSRASLRGTQSSFAAGAALAPRLSALSLAPVAPARGAPLRCEASGRVCQLTGTKANNGYVVTFSHKRNKKLQQPNLQWKRIYWPEAQRWVRLKVCTRALKTVEKRGLAAVAKDAGLDLSTLPYVDARPARVNWLAEQVVAPPQSKTRVGRSRKMRNAEKLAASTKTPLVARYVLGGPRVQLTRDPELVAATKIRGE